MEVEGVEEGEPDLEGLNMREGSGGGEGGEMG